MSKGLNMELSTVKDNLTISKFIHSKSLCLVQQQNKNILRKLCDYYIDNQNDDETLTQELNKLITLQATSINENNKKIILLKEILQDKELSVTNIDVKILKLEQNKKIFVDAKRFKEASLIQSELKLLIAERDALNNEKNNTIENLSVVENEIKQNKFNFEKYSLELHKISEEKQNDKCLFIKNKIKKNSNLKSMILKNTDIFSYVFIDLLQCDISTLYCEAKKIVNN